MKSMSEYLMHRFLKTAHTVYQIYGGGNEAETPAAGGERALLLKFQAGTGG